jgi:hypothetical protein
MKVRLLDETSETQNAELRERRRVRQSKLLTAEMMA